MKKIGRTWFPAMVVLIFGLAYLAVFGMHTADGSAVIRGVKDIRWGIDVSGGVSVTFGPSDESLNALSADDMTLAADILTRRLEEYGVSGHRIYTDRTNMRLIVNMPHSSDELNTADEIISHISVTAKMTIVEGRLGPKTLAVSYEDSYGRPIFVDSSGVKHRIALDDTQIVSAQKAQDEEGNTVVLLNFTEAGRQLFLESTGRLTAHSEHSSERYVTICMDGKSISEMYVERAADEAMISGRNGMTEAEADALVSYINNGALPFELQVMDYELIDATLGSESVKVMIVAGAAAFALICLFMIVRYRLPGVVACISLLGQIAGILAAVSGFFPVFDGFTLTLPGVAGIILSIGMGVDANIITGERVAEEIRKGKTIEGAISAGNENSFSSIFDGNVTVIIVSIILMGVFGPPDTVWGYLFKPLTWLIPVSTVNSIYSFGYTLFAGVVFNFIMGVVFSRIMLRSLSCYPVLRNRKLYGGGEMA